MRCPVCSFDNRAAARFCGQCGRPLGGVVECPSCASQNSAAQKHCDLIFMASHGRRGIARLMMGSVAQKVLTHSRVPVLVYR